MDSLVTPEVQAARAQEPLGEPITLRLPVSVESTLKQGSRKDRRRFAEWLRHWICDRVPPDTSEK